MDYGAKSCRAEITSVSAGIGGVWICIEIR